MPRPRLLVNKCYEWVSTDNRNVPLVTTLEVSPFRRKGNVRFLVNLPQWSGLWESGNPAGFAGFPSVVGKSAL